MKKINKNDFCKWLIILLCSYKTFRLLEIDVISVLFMMHSHDVDEAYVYSNYINAFLMLLGVLSCLFIIYYFLVCYKKNNDKKPLYIGCFLQAGYLISTTINFLVMYFVTDEFHAVSDNIYGVIQPFVSIVDSVILCAIFIVEGVTVLQNYKSVKIAKKTCITLYIIYFIVSLLAVVNLIMFSVTDTVASSGGIYSATDKEAVLHTLQMAFGYDSVINAVLSVFSFIANFYVLLYMCFMDKDYEKTTSN